ncbi:MAG: response regulator transcription factor [Candidatus Acidiferrales bacterium]
MAEGRILVVDDEPQIRRVMRATLVQEGYEVMDARSGPDALNRLHSEKFDLILLDINMPGLTGIETCRQIRLVSDVGIIMMTVRDKESDKVAALDVGADDYVTKPFSMPEMLARIRAVLRRNSTLPTTGISNVWIGDVEVDFRSRRLTSNGKQIRLSAKEFDLLAYLAAHPNRAIPHEELLHAVWGPEYGEEREYLRVFINRLRKKIEPSPQDPQFLIKEPWIGYSLKLSDK